MSTARKTAYSLKEAQPQLAALAARAQEGEAITLTADGEPVAQLVPFRPSRIGCMRGTIRVIGDDLASTADEWPHLA